MKPFRCLKSVSEFEKAKRIIPGGAHFTHRPLLKCEFPSYMEKGNGSHIWDIDGNEYIDYLLGFGAITLGHANAMINDAAIEQMKKGMMLSRPGTIQNRLVEKLIEMLPCAEMAYLFKDGSGATTAAIRIARAHTGREKVVRWGYNGWHDWCCQKWPLGIPSCNYESTIEMNYNDLNNLEEIFDSNKDEIACIIMEPTLMDKPDEDYLSAVKTLAINNGALLIFDEIKTFPRFSLSGAQGFFGVTPDMSTVGKGMANGFPISAVVGTKDVMNTAENVRLSATFNVEIVSMAAAMATLEIFQNGNVVDHIWRMGEVLISGLEKIVKQSGVEAGVVGYAPMPLLKFGYSDQKLNLAMRESFYTEALKRRIFYHPTHVWFVSNSHTEEDIRETLEASGQAIEATKKEVLG